MDTSEIKSPEGPQQGTPGSTSMSRKKLGIYFIESEDRRMAFGRGYTAGSTPVDIHGKSIVDLSKTGGWIAAFFIFGTDYIHKSILTIHLCVCIACTSITILSYLIDQCQNDWIGFTFLIINSERQKLLTVASPQN